MATDPIRNMSASLDLDPYSTNATLTLEPGWFLSGSVSKANSSGIAFAQVELVFQQDGLMGPFGIPVITDNEGKFEIKGLPHQRSFTAKISAKGFSSSRFNVSNIDSKSNRVDVGVVQLSEANLAVGGIVLDEKDAPIAGAWIICVGNEPSELSHRSDSQGNFLIRELGPGIVRVSAHNSKGRSAVIATDAGNTNITLRIQQSE